MKIFDFKHKKQQQEKITVLTCYDYAAARTIAATSLDCILVGDSVAMVVHGHNNTIMATMPMMLLHTQAVARGLGSQFLISDLPFLCHRISQADTLLNVQQLLQAGAHAIKIEGCDDDTCALIQYITLSGIPIVGHLGLTPQFIHQLGGYRIQGKDEQQAQLFLEQAQQLERAGCCALVLECIPARLAKIITENLAIPTIGIGAGKYTDGQVLVWHDILGLQDEFKPRFLKQYLLSKHNKIDAINNYIADVKLSLYPDDKHSII